MHILTSLQEAKDGDRDLPARDAARPLRRRLSTWPMRPGAAGRREERALQALNER